MGVDEPGRAKGTVVVTGAGRGIGRALSLILARSGYSLVLLSRSAGPLEETRCLCEDLTPVSAIVADVRDPGPLAALTEALASGGPVHAVVNNAGVGEWSPVHELSEESWRRQLDTNLTGAFHVVRATLPTLRRQRRGLYVNIGSDSSLVGISGRAAYNASKFGLVGLTMSMRAELAGDGVHASIIYAGKADTHFRGLQPGDRPGALRPELVAAAAAFIIDQYPDALVGELSVFPPGPGAAGPRTLV